MRRRHFLSSLAAAPALLPQPKKKLNVLMIAVDDLRPDLGCYGNKTVHTPNLDALAARGCVFENAYCQQAVCSPSRTSLLTGRRPDTTGIYELQTHFRKNLPDVVTLPQHFKNNGYTTSAFSKILHGGLDDPASWSIPAWFPNGPRWNTPENADRSAKLEARLREAGLRIPPPGARLRDNRPKVWDNPDVADDALPDGMTANMAVEALRTLKDQPFFLGVGFLKPHLPFIAPKRYFDLYANKQIEKTDYPERPRNAPDYAFHTNGELRTYQGVPEQGPIPEALAVDLIRAYYASASYTDAQIGKVLAELDRLGLRDNTIVAFWGDHGWQLGNHGLWHKHTNFEKATRAPLIVSAPGMKRGVRTKALTEFVDIYPSLVELAGLPAAAGTEGQSFRPLLEKPNLPGKPQALSQYPRGQVMGYSMRTRRYRMTAWMARKKSAEVKALELYDYEKDPQEAVNVADEASYAKTRTELLAQLKQAFQLS
jgi:iduronate 2-sulfatase